MNSARARPTRARGAPDQGRAGPVISRPGASPGPPAGPAQAGTSAAGPEPGRLDAVHAHTARALLIATRPRQWLKNILVFAAPGAAGLLGHPAVLARTAAAAAMFVLASSGTYLVNDALDASADRVHPEKRHRPVASGALTVPAALGAGGALLAAALGSAVLVGGARLLGVAAAYVGVSLAYTLWLKRVPVVELACVSSGFVLRAVAGGAAVSIPISHWFVIVASAGALLVVAGKRSAELATLGPASRAHRPVLERYPASFLRSVQVLAATVAVVGYALWAFERASLLDVGRSGADAIVFQLSIVPFVLGVLTVELAIEAGDGGAPEELALHNRALQALALACLAFVAFGIYA
ncbi:MAG TPA: decaprenyl-phosphate phosphoribosyltransferase [Acidimicrobiales bacterium]|nr:decaprenyl-phosphate phosphoribosyltransferase [Acidimicrobiales bacterium]